MNRAAVLFGLFAACGIDEDAAHRFGRGGKEVSPAGPRVVRRATDEPDVGLVDEGGRLERLAGLLDGQSLRRQFPQFVVDEREELLGGVGVAPLGGGQDVGDLAHELEDTRAGPV